ncbi:MAG: MbcA/ParS/Xre antitoxin family protein [Gemmatimonadota bacterium]
MADHAPGALRTFFRIADLWGLTATDARLLLGTPPTSTYYKWRSGDVRHVPRDLLERLSYIFGIYKALQVLLPVPAAADAWISRPNDAPLFAGRSALEVMRSGNVADLFLVRQYLDAQRGGWP